MDFILASIVHNTKNSVSEIKERIQSFLRDAPYKKGGPEKAGTKAKSKRIQNNEKTITDNNEPDITDSEIDDD